MSDLLEYNYGELKKAYEQVLAERDAAIAEVASLRQTINSMERGSARKTTLSSRGLGVPRDGSQRPVAGGPSGFNRG